MNGSFHYNTKQNHGTARLGVVLYTLHSIAHDGNINMTHPLSLCHLDDDVADAHGGVTRLPRRHEIHFVWGRLHSSKTHNTV